MCKKWRRTANTDANHQRTRVSTRGPARQRPEQMQLRDADTRKQVVPGEGRTQGRRTHGRGRCTQGSAHARQGAAHAGDGARTAGGSARRGRFAAQSSGQWLWDPPPPSGVKTLESPWGRLVGVPGSSEGRSHGGHVPRTATPP